MKASLTVLSLASLTAALTAGCGGGTDSPSTGATGSSSSPSTAAGSHACSPLDATAASPMTLANVLGAGRDADGTVYVLDDGAPTYRAFVSQGTVLQRKEVAGSGTVGGGAPGTESINASAEDATAPFALQIERTNGVATRMGVYRGELGAKSFEIGKQGDVLTLIGADVLSTFQVRNLPGNVVVEYSATTQDGHRLLVTRPMVDWTYSDFRVFYGRADQMLERHLTNASRGSTTYISFQLDGTEYTAIFSSALSAQTQSTLGTDPIQPGQPITVESAPGPASVAPLSFYCF